MSFRQTAARTGFCSWSIRDYIIYFVLIPLLLIFIQFLPVSILSHFVYIPSEPTFLAAFLSHYTHASISHLFSNLLAYLISMSLIFTLEPQKRFFRAFTLLAFLLLPFLLSVLQFLIQFAIPAYGLFTMTGFSGIVSAFRGYFLWSLFSYFRNSNLRISIYMYYFLFILNLLCLVISNYPGITIISVVAVFAALFLIFLWWDNSIRAVITIIYRLSRKFLKETNRAWLTIGRIILFLFTVYWIVALPELIPLNIISSNSYINTPVHYAGFIFGVFIPPILALIFTERRHHSPKPLNTPPRSRVILPE
jgi:hypothetical protein